MQNSSSTNISVVIATRNRAKLLGSCLASFECQDYDKSLFELIVINDGSTDDTESFLAKFRETTSLNLRSISQENKGVSFSRNLGISLASGRYVAFTDDDCIVPVNWLSRVASLWEAAGPEIAGIGGPLRTEPGNSYLSRYIHFLDEFNHIPVIGKHLITAVHISKLPENATIAYLRTSNAVFRKTFLQEVGGFDVDFKRPGGEDPDLCFRMLNLGVCFRLDKEMVVLHASRETLESYLGALRNYVAGEFRKKSKSRLYRNTIRSNYQFIPVRKAASLVLAVLSSPVAIIRLLSESRYSLPENVTFPLLLAASKCYALYCSLYYQVKFSLNRL